MEAIDPCLPLFNIARSNLTLILDARVVHAELVVPHGSLKN